jgi:GNAT superfamily N-acetyltransferase
MSNSSKISQRYVLIRPFTQGDEIECKKIAGFTVMSTVNRTFFSALFRETTFQLMVFLSAVLFIIVGLPFFYCAVSVPLTVTFLYSAIWSSAMMKSLEIQNELSLVKQQYQESSDKTTFLVAEYYSPLLDLNPGENITFISISSFQGLEDELFNKSKRVVGFLGITRNKEKACSSWLKRFAVDQNFKRRKIATELISTASHFCYERGYSSIEACITECQQEAKEFFLHHQFELEQLYHKSIMGSTAVYTKYLFRKDLKHTKSALNA